MDAEMSTADDRQVVEARVTALGLARTEIGATLRPRKDAPASGERRPLPRLVVDPTAAGGGDVEYALVSTLGEGGMGRVYLARQRSLERDVAVKTLKPGASSAALDALVRESRLTGSLEHPGVIPVHAFGVDDAGAPFLVMKRVDGVDLATLLAEPEHPVWRARAASDPLVARLEILMQLSLTVEFAHTRGVIHRDIKAANVMVGAFGEVYLLDWGIATTLDESLDPGMLVGTPVYLAPEMARGGAVDARTDVYLLGATLHEILTGQPRHEGQDITQVLVEAIRSAPVAYGDAVPEELASLANRATARDPHERPQSALAFRAELTQFLHHRGARALGDVAEERLVELDALLDAAGKARAPADLRRAYRLASEARFGFAQALREHPGDVGATDGLRRAALAAIELELRQGHADAAEALRAELAGDAPEVDRAIDELRRRLAQREREAERLRDLARDLDPTQGRSRGLWLGLFALLVPGAVAAISASGFLARAESGVAIAVAILGIVAGGIAARRRQILTNAFNRRASALLILAVSASLFNRTLGYLHGLSTPVVLGNDLLCYAIVAAASAIALIRGLWPCVPLLLAGVLATLRWPDRAVFCYAASVVVSLLLIARLLGGLRPDQVKVTRGRDV
jgi:eukaryotic-like serine/threonine-protein kinase